MTKDEFFKCWNADNQDWMIAINENPDIDEDRNIFHHIMIGFAPNRVVTGRVMLDFDDNEKDESEEVLPFDTPQLNEISGSAAEDTMTVKEHWGTMTCREPIEKVIDLVTEQNLEKYFGRIARMYQDDRISIRQVSEIFDLDIQECLSRIES